MPDGGPAMRQKGVWGRRWLDTKANITKSGQEGEASVSERPGLFPAQV